MKSLDMENKLIPLKKEQSISEFILVKLPQP